MFSLVAGMRIDQITAERLQKIQFRRLCIQCQLCPCAPPPRDAAHSKGKKTDWGKLLKLKLATYLCAGTITRDRMMGLGACDCSRRFAQLTSGAVLAQILYAFCTRAQGAQCKLLKTGCLLFWPTFSNKTSKGTRRASLKKKLDLQ
jgi:hypothetical protein